MLAKMLIFTNIKFLHLECICFFVDLAPMLGWEHEAHIVKVPFVWVNEQPLPLTTTVVSLPPNEELIPIDVKNRLGAKASHKPMVTTNLTNAIPEVANRTHAIILSGGYNVFANYERYWNDCSFIYQTLTKKYSIPRENITVLMSDGTDPAPDMHTTTGQYIDSPLDLDNNGIADVKYSATKSNVKVVIDSITPILNEDDHLLLFVTDHGGSDDELSTSYINLWNISENEGKLYDYELAEWLTPLTKKYVNINVVLGQCYSGGFIDDLTKTGCVVSTASTGSEYSWACPDIPYDEFLYHWTSAINGETAYGETVNADTDGNGRVTMEEAFYYAQSNDRRQSETPQFISTPNSVGEDLAFNWLAPAVDLYLKDTENDTGKEPNLSAIENFWNSCDIWARKRADGIEGHENPVYNGEGSSTSVYIKIRNRGKKDYTDTKYWIHLYWANASLGLTTKTFKGYEVIGGMVTGDHITPLMIPPIKAGCDTLVLFNWALPTPNPATEDNAHYCLTGRIMDYHRDDAYDPSMPYFNVVGDNNIIQKNLIIIRPTDLNKEFPLYVRNVYDKPQQYSIEIKPHSVEDSRIFNDAIVQLRMSTPIYNAWSKGGCQANAIETANTPQVVKLLSADSRLEAINLEANAFDEIAINLNFNTINMKNNYIFDIIQKDENGKIVGGETFLVNSKMIATGINISQEILQNGNIKLSTDLGNNASNARWIDSNGNDISRGATLTVDATSKTEQYTVTGITEDGNFAIGNIELEPSIGIKSVTPSVSVENYIDVEFYTDITTSDCNLVISPISGGINLTKTLMVGDKKIRIDVSSLPNGNYIVSFTKNGTVLNSVKFNK